MHNIQDEIKQLKARADTLDKYLQMLVQRRLQPFDDDLTAIAALSPSNDDIIQRKSGAWTNRTMAQLAADLAGDIDDSGTWTPALSFATPGTSSFAYSTQEGQYTRIAEKLVWLYCYLVFTPTIGTASGELRITGLPYDVSKDSGGSHVRHDADWSYNTNRSWINPYANTSERIVIGMYGTAVSRNIMDVNNLTSGNEHILQFTLVYASV